MKNSLEIKVPSKSQPGDYHTVSFDGKKIECNCVRKGYFLMNCSHIESAGKIALSFLDEIIKGRNNE